MRPRRRRNRRSGGTLEAILAITVLGAAAATFAPYAGAQAWWLDIFSHFRVHVAAATVAIGVFAIVVKRPRWAVLAMMLLGANLLEITPHVSGGAKADQAANQPLKVISFNIHNIRPEYHSVVSFLRDQTADVIILSEVPEQRHAELEPLRVHYPYWHVGSTSPFRGTEYPDSEQLFGLVVLSRLPLEEATDLKPADVKHPYGVRVALNVSGELLSLFAVHLAKPLYPGNAHMQTLELDGLSRAVSVEVDRGRKNIVIAGDMNLTPYAARFRQFLIRSDMRRLNTGIAPTWPTQLGLLGIPIDHVLARGDVDGAVMPGPDTGSDHLPLVGTLFIGG